MKNPKSFGDTFGVLNAAMVLIISLYVGMGFFGYLRYGHEPKGSITLNLPEEDPLAKTVKITIAFDIFITHSLQNYVAIDINLKYGLLRASPVQVYSPSIDITWNGYFAPSFEKNCHKLFYEYVARTLLVLFTFLLGIAIPNLELSISLIGAFCLAMLGIAFPAIVDQSNFWYQKKGRAIILMSVQNRALIAFGVLGLFIGTYVSIQYIIDHFLNGNL